MYKKLCFYREEVIKQLLRDGVFPDDELIYKKLSEIDTRMSLFKKYTFMPGTELNVVELNYTLEMIFKDLEILYEIAIELHNNDFTKLNSYVESHLNYLEATVDKYEKRAKEETNSTTLGKTIFFESNKFNVETLDDSVIIDLGNINLLKGTKIACFANVNNAEAADIKFEFDNLEKELSFETLAYNHNQETTLVPGELNLKTRDLELNKDFIVKDNIKLDFREDLNINSEYLLMGGKDYVHIKNLETLEEHIIPMPTFNMPIQLDYPAHITFYIVDGEDFEYMFNTRPVHTNFSLSNQAIKVRSDVHHVFINSPKDFTFGINLNKGNSYAVKENGIIKDNSLYYYGNSNVNSIQVREYIKDEVVSYNAKTIITTDAVGHIDVDCIYIKELS